MGPGSTGTDFGVSGTVNFGPGGISGGVSAGAGSGGAAPCGAGTQCGQNNFALIVLVIAVAVLILR